MNNHRSSCKLEPVECPFHEAGCTVEAVCRGFDKQIGKSARPSSSGAGSISGSKEKLGEKLLETKLGESKMKLADKKSPKKPVQTNWQGLANP